MRDSSLACILTMEITRFVQCISEAIKVVAGNSPSRALTDEFMKTLVVEDDRVSRLFLKAALSRFGECRTAVNGREAVEAVTAARKEGHPFDLVCMDIMMPEMDGQAALEKIRECERSAGQLATKIIMTTAVAERNRVATAVAGPCDAYLLKPIKLETLLQHLRALGLIS